MELLETIPNWYWDKWEQQWNKHYKLLVGYNDTLVAKYITECNVKLGSWCVNQKTNKKNGKLSQELIELLEKIPNWYWDKKTCPNQSLNLQSKQGNTNRRHKVRCLTYINNTNPWRPNIFTNISNNIPTNGTLIMRYRKKTNVHFRPKIFQEKNDTLSEYIARKEAKSSCRFGLRESRNQSVF